MAENQSDGIGSVNLSDGDSDEWITSGAGDKSGGVDDAIDPAAATPGSGSGNPSNGKRGRPKGSKNGERKTKQKGIDLSGIERILFSGHMMLAAMTKSPLLVLSEKESTDLTKAITDVSKFYMNLDASEKTVAWVNLAFACGSIYGPRFVAARVNAMANRAPRQQRQAPMQTMSPQQAAEAAQGNVVHFAPGHFAEPPDKGSVG